MGIGTSVVTILVGLALAAGVGPAGIGPVPGRLLGEVLCIVGVVGLAVSLILNQQRVRARQLDERTQPRRRWRGLPRRPRGKTS